jgi:hypothetical protein
VTSQIAADVWHAIAAEAARESTLWADALREDDERERVPVFSPLGDERYALGLETIYEGYLLHYGRSRLFAPADADTALLLGDYLYAHGLVHISAFGIVAAVADLAELISLAAQVRAEETGDDGPLWAATAALLAEDALAEARASLRLRRDTSALLELAAGATSPDALKLALATHADRLR